jgi:hypothetical protein
LQDKKITTVDLLIFGWESGISCPGIGIDQKKLNRKWEWDYDSVKIWAGK